jgi:hypothetical protein
MHSSILFLVLYSGRPIIGDNEPTQIGEELVALVCCLPGGAGVVAAGGTNTKVK